MPAGLVIIRDLEATDVAIAPDAGLAGLAADERGRLAGVLTLSVLPSIYTGAPWAHIEDLIEEDGAVEPATAALLLDEALRRLARDGVTDASIDAGMIDERVAALCRERGFGAEELLVLERRGPAPTAATGPQAIEVRAGEAGDADAIAVLVRSFADEYGEPSDADATSVAAYLRQPGVGALLAGSGGVPLGMLAHSRAFSLGRGGAYAMIDDLVVRADARRRGAATALLTAALAGFAAEGLETASLWMQPGSEPAMRLYEGWGFSVTGTLLVRHEGPHPEG